MKTSNHRTDNPTDVFTAKGRAAASLRNGSILSTLHRCNLER
jgi:hypothetical protein